MLMYINTIPGLMANDKNNTSAETEPKHCPLYCVIYYTSATSSSKQRCQAASFVTSLCHARLIGSHKNILIL